MRDAARDMKAWKKKRKIRKTWFSSKKLFKKLVKKTGKFGEYLKKILTPMKHFLIIKPIPIFQAASQLIMRRQTQSERNLASYTESDIDFISNLLKPSTSDLYTTSHEEALSPYIPSETARI